MILVIRADASPSIGAGHAMRCMALAQAAILRGMPVHFITRCSIPLVQERLEGMLCAVTNLPDTCSLEEEMDLLLSIVTKHDSSMIILDGYHFNPEYQAAVHRFSQLAIIDDFAHQPAYFCDILINPNTSFDQISYQDRTQAQLFIGHKYVMLRSEFLQTVPSVVKEAPAPFRILITMGASDPANATLRIIKDIALAQLDGISLIVLMGSNSPNKESITENLDKLRCRTEVLTDVLDMPALLQSMDIAISAASSTCFELAKMGIPTLALVTAPNQHYLVKSLEKLGCIRCIGNADSLSGNWLMMLQELLSNAAQRKALHEKAIRAVDGAGANRILEAIEPTALRLRRAVDLDCTPIWQIANDPVVRSASFSTDSIPFETHTAWYSNALTSKNSYIYVAENQHNSLVGYIRFALNDQSRSEPLSATISVAIAQPFRGCRLGARLIAESSAIFTRESTATCIHAYIKPENVSSISSFESAGYHRSEACSPHTHDSLLYTFGGDSIEQ